MASLLKKVYIRKENNNNIRSYEIISRKKASEIP